MDDKEILCNLFCKLLFKEGSLDEQETQDLRHYVKNFLLIREEHVPYGYLTEYIYTHNDIEDVKYIEKINSISDVNNKKFLSKTASNIKLAIVQKKYIEQTFKRMSKGIAEINDLKSKIYTDFITILGIFTAITFAAFGGIQLIGNLFNNINSRNSNQILFLGDTLILSSLFGLIMYGIIMTLFIGINKVTSMGEKYIFDKKITFFILIVLFLLMIAGIFCLFSRAGIDIKINIKQ